MNRVRRFGFTLCLIGLSAFQLGMPFGFRASLLNHPPDLLRSFGGFAMRQLVIGEAEASCNLIPVAAKTYPSKLGGVVSPIAGPGKTVEVALKACDQPDGFEPIASDNHITLTFAPPNGPTKVVQDMLAAVSGLCAGLCSNAGEVCASEGDCSCPWIVGSGKKCLPSITVDPEQCDLPGGKCRNLQFVMRRVDGDVGLPAPCAGLPLAGPVAVTVKNSSNIVVAQIGSLYRPTDGCDKAREQIFEHFTVLPPPNDAKYLADNPGTQMLATVDGGNNLLIPVNWLDVLPGGPGSPVARLMDGASSVTAFTSPHCSVERSTSCAADSDCLLSGDTCDFALQGSLLNIPSSEFVRSFTLDGRPLPPLLRADDTGGGVFGTADAIESVIRISRMDPAWVVSDIFDFTDRLCCGQGPIIINFGGSYPGGGCGGGMSALPGTYGVAVTTGSVVLTEGEPVPLKGLRSSTDVVAFVGNDGAVRVVDVASGVSTNTSLQVLEISSGLTSRPALKTSGLLTALLEPQPPNGNAARLRVLGSDGTDLTSSFSLPAAPAAMVNGSTLAISEPLVFFREPRSGLSFVEAFYDDDDPGGVDGLTKAWNATLSPDGAHLYVTALSDSAVAVFSRNPVTGRLTFVTAEFDQRCAKGNVGTPCAGDVECDTIPGAGDGVCVDGLDSPRGVAVSPDGAHLYVNGSNSLAVFDRDSRSGMLTFVEAHFDDIVGGLLEGLWGSVGVTLSPDGAHVYVTASADAALSAFSRNPTTGALTLVETYKDGVGGVDGLGGASWASVSPDGTHVYVAGVNDDAVAVFTRNPATGALTFVEAQFDNRCAEGSVGSPCAAHVDCDTAPGAGDGLCIDGLDGAVNVTVSPDGAHVYLASEYDGAVVVFDRNPATGALAFVEAQFGENWCKLGNVGASCTSSADCDTFPGAGDGWCGSSMFGACWVAVSPDGEQVYVAAFGTGAITVFSRSAITGALAYVEPEFSGTFGVHGLDEPQGIAISADGAHVYVASPNLFTPPASVVVFRREAALKVFDTGTSSLRSAAETGASVVAVTNQRAAVLTSEGNWGGTDLNFDGDTADQVAQIYDGVSDSLTSLGIAANRLAISPGLVALTVPEADEAGIIRNGDGDSLDDVLAVHEIGTTLPVDNIGVAADSIAVTEVCFGGDEVGIPCKADSDCPPDGSCHKIVVFITLEADENGALLNGDGDADDRVLRIYDQTTDQIVEVGEAAEEFVVGGRLVAFRTSEAAQGDTVLNGDVDTLDAVMQVYDIAKDEVIPTGQAAIKCERPGCEQFSPYGVKGDTVSFLTDERGQDADLNRDDWQGTCVGGLNPDDRCDGDTDCNGGSCRGDVVLQVFNVISRQLQRYDLTQKNLSQEPDCALLSPLPQEFMGATILYVEKKEFELGIDLNGDGDTDDCVIFVEGDGDGDGTPDAADTCPDTENPSQSDLDLDGLGDVCDPRVFCSAFVPLAPPVVSVSQEKCQRAIGKAAVAYLKKRGVAVRKCLDRIAKGDLSGDPTAVCRGDFVGGAEIPPEDAATAAKFSRAADKFLARVQAKCPSQAAISPAACGATASELADCVPASYGTGVILASDRAYGNVTSLSPSLRKCQAAVGKVSASYLKSVTKAMQGCLDRVNKGKLAGDSQALCLGSLGDRCVGGASPGSPCCPDGGVCDAPTGNCIGGTNDGLLCTDACGGGGATCEVGLVAPTDAKTAQKIEKADGKLRKVVTGKCPVGTLDDMAMDVCDTDAAAVGDCLSCDHWRQAVESIGSAYGLQ